MATVLWRNRRDGGLDRCSFQAGPNGFRLSGTALLVADDRPYEVRYTVMADQRWRTRSVGVHVQGPDEDQRLALSADGEGGWVLGREPLPQLQGALDVDLAVTPATNTLPIRRLSLSPGASADLAVAYVSLWDLTPEPLDQRYERLAEDRYRYSNPGFSAELVVDGDGLVRTYEGAWELVARTPAGEGT
ncbi:MAG: putative glycolipid-binding domain-containing protein [Actinomycetota bacterium]|nr:putative glycolipid-binding domain-containing protein [Actinomycetota bacterium]